MKGRKWDKLGENGDDISLSEVEGQSSYVDIRRVLVLQGGNGVSTREDSGFEDDEGE
jgi:hypothetical protein